jgi:non-ribosomal peptide synthetase component F
VEICGFYLFAGLVLEEGMSENHVLPQQRVLFAPAPEISRFIGVPRLLVQRAAHKPQAPALVCGGRSVSYGELELRSAALARRLHALEMGPESVVAVFLERSPEALVALMGILRAGCTYLPLDPDYPHERLAWMLEDSGASVVLTRDGLRSSLPGAAPLVLSIDGFAEGSFAAAPEPRAIDAADPRGLAYLLYTSGSTGRPKGVGVSHAALLHHVQAMSRAYRLVPRDRVLQFASLSG